MELTCMPTNDGKGMELSADSGFKPQEDFYWQKWGMRACGRLTSTELAMLCPACLTLPHQGLLAHQNLLSSEVLPGGLVQWYPLDPR